MAPSRTARRDTRRSSTPARSRIVVVAPIVWTIFGLALPSSGSAEEPDRGIVFATSLDLSRHIAADLSAIRDRAADLARYAPALPGATVTALRTLFGEDAPVGPTALRIIVLWIGGWLAEWLFRRWTATWGKHVVANPLATVRQRASAQAQRLLFAQGLILSFGLGTCLAYLFVAMPGALGVFVLNVVIGVVAVRSAMAMGRFLLAPGGARFRLVALSTRAAWRLYRWLGLLSVTTALGIEIAGLLGVASAGRELVDAARHLTLLVVSILVPLAVMSTLRAHRESRHAPPGPAAVALGLAPPVAWLLLAASLDSAAEVVLVLGLAPIVSTGLGDVVRTIAFGPNRSGSLAAQERTIARVARLAAMIAALVCIAFVLRGAATGSLSSIAVDTTTALAVLLGGNLVWQLVRSAIDTRLADDDEGGSRADRLTTILPALRTTILIAITVVAGLTAASAIGLQIGPILAGAGVIGLSIGFGAQTLVRDVIAGFFLLLDDAFRIGEFIESGSIQGQVEAFSIRSVRLRDDNGHVHTVAFGELKAVTNYSRDWAGLEVPIVVAAGAPVEAVSAIVVEAAESVANDDVLGEWLLAPPRFLGVTAVNETSFRLAVLIRTLPGKQFAVRSALLRLVLVRLPAAGIGSAEDQNRRPGVSTTSPRTEP